MENNMMEKLSQYRWLWRKQWHRKYAFGNMLADETSGQGRIIALLKVGDGISAKQMTYLLGVHFSTVTESLAKLEKGGYIVREVSAEDGRVMLVKLTDKGRAVQQDKGDGVYGAVVSCFSAGERETFCEYLDRIVGVLQKELDIDADEAKEQMQAWRERKRGRHCGCGKGHGHQG
jgi:DNA-binding MarR family transcriptional regulator